MIHVADILDHFGVTHRGCRCACPIHGGDNPTSFSFDDEVYYCFSCGAKGNAITLVEYLQGLDRKGAVEYLRERFGASDFDYTPQVHRVNGRKSSVILREPTELFILKSRQHSLEQSKIVLTQHIAWLRWQLEHRIITLSHFHADDQKIEQNLIELDEESISLNYRIKNFTHGG